MRTFSLCLSLLMPLVAGSVLAQNTPAAGAKPGEQKAAEQKTGEPKPPAAPADKNAKQPANGKPADAKAAAQPGNAKIPDSAASVTAEKDPRKNLKADGPPCVVAEFRALGIDVHDPAKRRTQAMAWLKKRAKNCSVDQLLMIRNNRSQWMGTADSATMAAEVDALLEVFAADNPQVAALLYGTVQPPSEGSK